MGEPETTTQPYELPSDQSHHQQPVTPSIGRMVHQVAQGSADGVYAPVPRPAHITSVIDDYRVRLFVITDTGTFHHPDCHYHPGDPAPDHELDWPVWYRDPHDGRAYPAGTWHWPPRV